MILLSLLTPNSTLSTPHLLDEAKNSTSSTHSFSRALPVRWRYSCEQRGHDVSCHGTYIPIRERNKREVKERLALPNLSQPGTETIELNCRVNAPFTQLTASTTKDHHLPLPGACIVLHL
jgi:hypothetical protein